MYSNRLYRRLAIVNILHRYFLDTETADYFSLPDKDRDMHLANLITNGQYQLMNDLVIQPTEETKKILQTSQIIYKLLPQGLLLGVAVKQETVKGVVRSKPVIALDSKLRLQFQIHLKNSFQSYSATNLNPIIPAAYYFTNDTLTKGKQYPSLCLPIQPFKSGRLYEMGETAIVGGVPSQAINRTGETLQQNWTPLTDRHYVSEYDRILINKNFIYTFEQAGIKEATFVLSSDQEVVKTIQMSDEGGLANATLNFNKGDDGNPIVDGMYRMIVSGSGNYLREIEIYLDSKLLSRGVWGLLDIALHTEVAEFSPLDKDGYLLKDDFSEYPRLELRFLNRSTYWKYYFQKKPPVDIDPAWDELPSPPGIQKVIISKQPFALRKAFHKVKYKMNFLPNPTGHKLSRESGKICSEILLTTIKL